MVYYFRGNINFFHGNRSLKNLAYVWIFQNLLLAFSAAYKNLIYIQEFSLTYKRIGVFVYLLLTVIGLITTYQKLSRRRTLWYLLHINTWSVVVILFISSFISWDIFITRHNLQRSNKPDFKYLINLSNANIPLLVPYLESAQLEENEKQALTEKIETFKSVEIAQSWLSWNYQDYLITRSLDNEE